MDLYNTLIDKAINGGGGGGGSSDFDTARVTFNFTAPAGYTIDFIGFTADFELDDSSLYSNQGDTTSNYVDVLTYKGTAMMTYGSIFAATLEETDLFIDLDTMAVAGSISYDSDNSMFIITGNGTITATLSDEPPK